MNTSPPVSLRAAGDLDGEIAYQARKAAFQECAARIGPWDEAEQRRLHDRRLREHTYRIIQVQDRDVGVLVTSDPPDALKVHQLFLLPDEQGAGVGEACMRVVRGEARARGVPVRLRVLEVNPRAQAFFERLGFRGTGETATHVLLEAAE